MKEYIHILQTGGVIAAPTDTVYGLLADATNAKAVKKVFAIKGRKEDKPLPIFIPSLDAIKDIALVSEKELRWLKTIWPGKITAVMRLKPAASIAPEAVSQENTIALRIPNHPLILTLLKSYKKPLTGTSANRSGAPSCLDAACVREQLSNPSPDIIIDEGSLEQSQPSTIIDLTKSPPAIIRKGAGYEKAFMNAEKTL